MTTYKELFGKAVKFLSSDPANDAEGQVWYNSTSGTFKSVVATSTWSSAAPLITGRNSLGGAGTQTAGLAFGGVSAGPTFVALTEEYNGSGWSNGGNMNTARILTTGAGTQTAGLCAGGFAPPSTGATEEYDGSTWTTVTSLNTPRRTMAGSAGTQTAALVFGGYEDAGVGFSTAVESYNGTSWTSLTGIPVGNFGIGGAGTQTAALGFGGGDSVPSIVNTTISWNGSSWTIVDSLNSARQYVGGGGLQTAAIAFGGIAPPGSQTGVTELYDGSTWSNSTNMGTSRSSMATAKAGTQSAMLGAGGYQVPGIRLANTEEYNFSANVIIPAAWASGGNLSTARTTAGDCGIQTAGLIANGGIGTAPYTSNATEEYDGSTWTSGGNTPFLSSDLSAAGTQTAALGFASGDSPTTAVITYDGSTWTTSPATYPPQSPGSQHRGIGTQTAAISVGMGTGSLNWDGSSWASGPSTNTPRNGQKPAGWGTQTSAIVATGFQNPTTLTSNSESFNGTLFTEEGLVLTAVRRVGGTTSASGSDGFFTGGSTAAGSFTYTTQTQAWDGTVWYTSANLANARLNHMGFGTNNSAAVTGGQLSTGITNTTEEFTGETSAFNYKTITTS
jgi:hypothetical protein